MTNTETEEWEELDSLDTVKVGDELEYTAKGSNMEHRCWGKVYKISDSHGTVVHVEGDWHLVDESLSVPDREVLLKRKVVVPAFPTKSGAVIAYERGLRDGTLEIITYVRVGDRADKACWIKASTGERWAEWEMELIHPNDTLTIVSDGN